MKRKVGKGSAGPVESRPLKWNDVAKSDLDSALAAVIHLHDTHAAKNLISYFHERMANGLPYDHEVLHTYIAHAFARIEEGGKSAEVALGLRLGRGKYSRPDTTERDVGAAAYVILHMRNGCRFQDAIGEAANLLFEEGKGDKAVEAAYARYREEMQFSSDSFLEQLLSEVTPFIKRDMTG